MKSACFITPGKISNELQKMILAASESFEPVFISDVSKLTALKDKKIVFCVELNKAGMNLELLEMLSKLYEVGEDSLAGSAGAVLIHSPNQLYTKSVSQNIVFLANQLGCQFLGHPVVEATGDMENFTTWQKTMDLSLEEISIELSRRLGQRLSEYKPTKIDNPNILVLHSSSRNTSNTLELWHMVSKHIPSSWITELHVENGKVEDCIGCSYKTCIHYSKQRSCFYGGVMVRDIFPAIQKADTLVWICPNYNDAISANLTAVINRLTALYRATSFYNKTLFSVIVSGNSGSDSVAKQLIGALNINKGFRLPANFAIMTIANDRGEINNVKGIEDKAYNFAKSIMSQTCYSFNLSVK